MPGQNPRGKPVPPTGNARHFQTIDFFVAFPLIVDRGHYRPINDLASRSVGTVPYFHRYIPMRQFPEPDPDGQSDRLPDLHVSVLLNLVNAN